MSVPKLIAFDLDGTVWYPDMYLLWGGGSPFSPVDDRATVLKDKAGKKVELLGVCHELFDELSQSDKYKDTIIAWVSCTDEPKWAQECLQKFRTAQGLAIKEVAHASQIFIDDKQSHFRNLKKEYPHIEYSEMLFFDNEYRNIRTVAKLGVKCVHCEDGVTKEAWEQGLALFR